MKIKYEFATETIEVEVSEEMYALHMELDRVEYNNNHRETRRHVSLDTGLEHSDWLRSYDSDVCCRRRCRQNKSGNKCSVRFTEGSDSEDI